MTQQEQPPIYPRAQLRESSDIIKILDPLVKEWFFSKFKEFSDSQLYGVMNIYERKNILISAATGSTKTLTAFLSILNYLITLARKNELENKVYCIYSSPLKALNNDIFVNLTKPLKEIEELARIKGIELQKIRIGLRTGDTTTNEKTKMLKNPPHIFITTPESLAIVLTSKRFIELFYGVEFLIVDEIHSLDNKRGVYLSISLERLETISKITPVRIGLSATIEPLDVVANFLVGRDRQCLIADIKSTKKTEIKVLTAVTDLIDTDAYNLHSSLYGLIDKLIQEHKTTIVFTNTRAATERVISHLKDLFPENYIENIGAHHSALSKEHRFEIEEKLRNGELKCVVCLSGNTKILDNKGNWTKIKDIKKEKIQSVNNRLKINENKVKNIFKIKNDENLLKVKTEFGKEIICTRDHKFLVIDDSGNLSWKEAENIEIGDFVGTMRNYKFNELKGEEIETVIFDNYPEKYFLFLKKEFLDELKSMILSKHKTIKEYWQNNFKNELGYSQFIHTLKGEYGFKIKVLRKIIEFLNISKIEAFKSISFVSSEKYKMPKLVINQDMMRLLGFMLAEGYITEETLFVSNRNKNLLDYYKKLIKNLVGKEPWEKKGSTGTPILGWSSKFLGGFLKNLGFKYGRKARISNAPNFIFRLNSDLIFSFLSGYLDGDGYVERKKKDDRIYAVGFCTASKDMAEDLSRLLLREGILSSIRSKYCDEIQKLKDGGEIIKRGWFYDVVVLGGNNLRKFAEKINPIRENLMRVKEVLNLEGYTNRDVIPNLGEKLRALRNKIDISSYKLQKLGLNPIKYELGTREISRKQLGKLLSLYKSKNKFLSYLANSDLFWEKIKSKEEIGQEEFVYNLEVENDHNYIANDFLTKNCSTSLELGIDIGFIDLVILLGSPKSSARALQRIGRAGHKLHDISKGRFIVLDRDDLVECAILAKEAIERKIDKIHIPRNCLDVLSQQIYGMSIQKTWDIDEMFSVIKKSYCYSNLSKEDFMSVISYLTGDYGLENRNVYAKIWYDKDTKQVGKKGKLARVIYMTNIGTIPEESFMTVVIGQGQGKDQKIGMIDEAFLEKMKISDVFVLGGKKYQFLYTKGMKVYVKAGIKKNPTIPSWFSEMLPLSFDSAMEIQRFRKLLNEKFEKKQSKQQIIDWIKEYTYSQDSVALAIYRYFYEQYNYAKIPHKTQFIIEKYNGEKNYVIFHSLYGRRVNDALSRAIAYLIGQKTKRDIEIGINDNGFYLAGENLPIEKAMSLLTPENLHEILNEAISNTEILKRRFRHCAARSLMILRNYKGRRKSVGKQQMSSFFLLNTINKLTKNFPILKEARREVLEDLMDIEQAKQVLQWIKDKQVNIITINTSLPSPFATNLILQGHYDLMRMEDKIEFLKRIHNEVMKEIIGKRGME